MSSCALVSKNEVKIRKDLTVHIHFEDSSQDKDILAVLNDLKEVTTKHSNSILWLYELIALIEGK